MDFNKPLSDAVKEWSETAAGRPFGLPKMQVQVCEEDQMLEYRPNNRPGFSMDQLVGHSDKICSEAPSFRPAGRFERRYSERRPSRC